MPEVPMRCARERRIQTSELKDTGYAISDDLNCSRRRVSRLTRDWRGSPPTQQ